jgi:hypothetical protein
MNDTSQPVAVPSKEYDYADLLGLEANVRRVAREQKAYRMNTIAALEQAADVLHELAEKANIHRGCGIDCTLPAGHLGDHIPPQASEDVVEMLRDPSCTFNSGYRFIAANEIERLRNKLPADETPAGGPDSWEANAKYLLDRCPHTIRVREGGGPENLMHSFVHTFTAMERKLEQPIAARVGTPVAR